jgi:hypothetical protein
MLLRQCGAGELGRFPVEGRQRQGVGLRRQRQVQAVGEVCVPVREKLHGHAERSFQFKNENAGFQQGGQTPLQFGFGIPVA